MPVSSTWPAYLGELGCCLRHNLGSGGCFWRLGDEKWEAKETWKNTGKTQEISGGHEMRGCVASWGQSGLRGSIQCFNLAQDGPT